MGVSLVSLLASVVVHQQHPTRVTPRGTAGKGVAKEVDHHQQHQQNSHWMYPVGVMMMVEPELEEGENSGSTSIGAAELNLFRR